MKALELLKSAWLTSGDGVKIALVLAIAAIVGVVIASGGGEWLLMLLGL